MKVFLSLVNLLFCPGISFGQLVECPSEGTSYFPHPDCTLFVVCINGEPSEVKCPQPLYYNPRTEHCEFPENVPECVGGTRPPIIGTTTALTTTTEKPPEDTLTECGQTIEADSGYIQYKLNQNFSAGQLCAFLIKLVDREGCDFTLEDHGISNTSIDTITVFRVAGEPRDLESAKLDEIDSPVYLPNSTFAVVFKTSTNLGTGFRLRFQSRPESSSKIPGSLLVFNNQTRFPFRFPLKYNVTRVSELDTVIVTSGAKMLPDLGPMLQLDVFDYYVDPACDTWFVIHSFDGRNSRFEGRTCIPSDVGKKVATFNTRGLFIVVFYKNARMPSGYYGSIEWAEKSVNEIR